MTIYRVELDSEHYMSMEIPGKTVINIMRGSIPGQSLAASWKDVSGSLSQSDETAKNNLIPDITRWYTHLAFSAAAFNQLKDKLEGYGEFLPVSTQIGVWYVFNVLATEEVDKSRSEAEIVNGVQVGVIRITFKNSSPDKAVFKTDFDKCSRIFCTEAFKELVDACNYKGLTFESELV